MEKVNIIGAGLAGLSAACCLAENNIPSRLISVQPSERAQSVLAAGGINGALNTMGENDCTENHMEDTLRAGVYIADPEAVRGMTKAAPGIITDMHRIGVPFNLKDGKIVQRNFGGQKKKRTAYAKSSTGKMLMTALIDEARKHETNGLIERYAHHELTGILIKSAESEKRECIGVTVADTYNRGQQTFAGKTILAFGGMNGLFPGITTGTTANSGEAAAIAFASGIRFSNLEMIQYHPTTIGIAGKRCLISEAARGEGGRLFVMREGKPWYYMEEKYPELGNLMPRDVVSRESWFVLHDPSCDDQVYLDMSHLSKEVWKDRLPDLREEVMHYLGIDPAKKPVPVDPAIHYFMGGIDVDISHRTNVAGLYAAGECCSQYHGANRLGGNSTLGAIYGGRVAARDLAETLMASNKRQKEEDQTAPEQISTPELPRPGTVLDIGEILKESLGIVRDGEQMETGLEKLKRLEPEANQSEKRRLYLAEAILLSALYRKESRGAHYRRDYPEKNDAFRGLVTAEMTDDGIQIGNLAAGEQ